MDLTGEPDFRIGTLEIRPSSCEVLSSGGVVRVEPRIMQVLVHLWRRQPNVVSRDDLVRHCWGGVTVGDNAIQRAISGVRRIAELDGSFSIETLARLGYRLRLAQAASDPAEAASAPAAPRARLAAYALSGVAAAAALVAFLMGALAPQASTPPRIAALSFATANAELQPFAQSLSDRIVNASAANDLLPVTQDAYAARRADVSILVDGTVRREGDRLIVEATAIHRASGVVLWTHETSRRSDEDAALREQVAARVVDVLRCALREDRARSARLPPDVLSLFLRACEARRFNQGNWDELRDVALELTERAPSVSASWSLLGVAAANESFFSPPARAAALREEAALAASRALRLDPRNADAILTQANLSSATLERLALTERALVAAPESPEANHAFSYRLYELGYLQDAAHYARRARTLDPLSRRYATLAVRILMSAGARDEAMALARELPRYWPDYQPARSEHFLFLFFAGDARDSRQALAYAVREGLLDDEDVRDLLETFLIVRASGSPQEKARLAQRVWRLRGEGLIGSKIAVILLAQLGDVDRAYELIDDVVRSDQGTYFLFSSLLLDMRRDARFKALMDRHGLTQAWRGVGRLPDFCEDPHLAYSCNSLD